MDDAGQESRPVRARLMSCRPGGPAIDLGMIDEAVARRLFGMEESQDCVVDIDAVRRRQAEMDELLGD